MHVSLALLQMWAFYRMAMALHEYYLLASAGYDAVK
jgi:hypothetical protein